MVDGLITKAFNVWYQVSLDGGRTINCRPRGRLQLAGAGSQTEARGRRGEKSTGRGRDFAVPARTLLVGDRVLVTPLPDGTGVIDEVLPRRNELVRPRVANVDQLLLVLTWVEPPMNTELVDRILVQAEREGLSSVLIMNKEDLLGPEEKRQAEDWLAVYRAAGYPCMMVSALKGRGVDAVRPFLQGKVSVVAGQSGVGKSCLLNALGLAVSLRTGAVSAKAGRGRHTTRHVELLPVGGGWVADAPGFSRMDLLSVTKEELAACFPEIARSASGCRFRGCLHVQEPDCAVRRDAAAGVIDPGRYARYLTFLDEIREREAFRY